MRPVDIKSRISPRSESRRHHTRGPLSTEVFPRQYVVIVQFQKRLTCKLYIRLIFIIPKCIVDVEVPRSLRPTHRSGRGIGRDVVDCFLEFWAILLNNIDLRGGKGPPRSRGGCYSQGLRVIQNSQQHSTTPDSYVTSTSYMFNHVFWLNIKSAYLVTTVNSEKGPWVFCESRLYSRRHQEYGR